MAERQGKAQKTVAAATASHASFTYIAFVALSAVWNRRFKQWKELMLLLKRTLPPSIAEGGVREINCSRIVELDARNIREGRME